MFFVDICMSQLGECSSFVYNERPTAVNYFFIYSGTLIDRTPIYCSTVFTALPALTPFFPIYLAIFFSLKRPGKSGFYIPIIKLFPGCIGVIILFRIAPMPVLVPLTFDRFVAVVFPLNYKMIISNFTAKIMVVLTWIPILMLLCYDSITYAMGTTEVSIDLGS